MNRSAGTTVRGSSRCFVPGSGRELFWAAASQHALAREWGLNLAGGETASQLESAGNVVEGNFRKRSLAIWGACAAAVVLSLFVWKWSADESGAGEVASGESEAPVAMLGISEDAVWTGGKAGKELRPGKMVLKSGIVRIDFYSGARAWLEGPAEFRLVSAMEMHLAGGRVKVKVVPAAQGFTVTTPELLAKDIGTEFGVMAEGAERNEVHVFSGRVEVGLPGAASEISTIGGGDGLKLSGGKLVPIAADLSAFPDPEQISKQQQSDYRRAHSAMVASRDGLSSAEETLLHYVFPKAAEGTVPNAAAGADAETDGTIIGGHRGLDAGREQARWSSTA